MPGNPRWPANYQPITKIGEKFAIRPSFDFIDKKQALTLRYKVICLKRTPAGFTNARW